MTAAMTEGRPEIVGIAQYGDGAGRTDFEIGWPEFDRHTAWARRLVAAVHLSTLARNLLHVLDLLRLGRPRLAHRL